MYVAIGKMLLAPVHTLDSSSLINRLGLGLDVPRSKSWIDWLGGSLSCVVEYVRK